MRATFYMIATIVLGGLVIASRPLRAESTLITEQRDAARGVLATQCGPCHTPFLETSLPGALAIFNLDNQFWERGVSERQRADIVGRLQQRTKFSREEIAALMPKGALLPPRPTSDEINRVKSFFALRPPENVSSF